MLGEILGGLIGGGLGLLGQHSANQTNIHLANQAQSFNQAEGLKNRQFADYQQNKTQYFNSAEALKNRQWMEEMSNTSFQRSMKDMRAAGLNPMLAYMKGGASTPSGSAASSGTASASSGSGGVAARVENTLAGAVNSAVQTASMFGQFRKLDSEVAKNAADAQYSLQSAKRAEADAQFIQEQNKRAGELHPTAKGKAEFDYKMQSKYGEFEKWLDMLGKGANSAGALMDLAPTGKAKDYLYNEWKKYQQRQP